MAFGLLYWRVRYSEGVSNMSELRIRFYTKILWLIGGFVAGATALSIASGSVPKARNVTDDTVLHRDLSEIRVKKERDLSFRRDVRKLSKMERRFYEKLPRLDRNGRIARVENPRRRIIRQAKKYRFGKKRSRRYARKKR